MSKFDAIKDRARKLIHEDAQKDAHIIRERNADRAKITMRTAGATPTPFDNMAPSYGGNGASMLGSMSESSYVDNSENRLNEAIDSRMDALIESRRNSQQSTQPISTTNSRLPKEILESFAKNPLHTEDEIPVLDSMGVTNGHQVINETIQRPQVEAKVDYELIKSIVESTVKKYMGALSKKLLSESKNNSDNNVAAVQITGDKFIMVTKNGDLYEANMVYKKNVNKK